MINNREKALSGKRDRTNGFLDSKSVKLSLGQSAPDFRLVDLVGISVASVNADNVVDQDVHSFGMLLVLREDGERFLVQASLGCNSCDLVHVISIQAVDVAHNLALVRTDGSEEKEVLQALVVAEWRRLNDDLLQKFDELDGQIVLHEGLDSHGHIICTGALRHSDSHDLID